MATERWERGAWRRVVSIIVVVWFGGILAACGSGATDHPDDDDSVDEGLPAPIDQDDDASGDAGGGAGDGDIEFTFGLPTGPVGPTGEDDPVFEALRDQGCEAAQSELDERRDRLVDRAVLLYQAAIHLCRGDRDQAGQLFDQVTLPLWAQACPWYQAIGSVLQQQQPSSIYCPTDDDEAGGDAGGGDTTDTTTDTTGGDTTVTTDSDGAGEGGTEGHQSDSS